MFAPQVAGDNEKALFLQRMCTYAARKGHEKSQGLIRVSVPGYVKTSFIRMSSGNLILKSL